jgi:glycosyltransferase involved in cell wall biosynthesis
MVEILKSRRSQRDAEEKARHEQTIADLTRELHAREQTLQAVLNSRSWRLTAPYRLLREPGGPAKVAKAIARRLTGRPKPVNPTEPRTALVQAPVQASAAKAFPELRVLIVAELSLAQCAKYRVWQKQRAFELLGVRCDVVAWSEASAARNALQTCSLAIFYRTPGYDSVLELIAEARRLRVPTLWEADDLIFDEASYLENRNLDTLAPELRASVLAGVPLFNAALRACDGAIASTQALADAMCRAGSKEVFVVENGLDEPTLALAERLRAGRRRRKAGPVIFYGSGSLAHDADFAVAAPGVLEALRRFPKARLRIVGTLTLPPAFEPLADRIERLPAVDYDSYLTLLADADLALAPLETTRFNDAKSNIKWLEAAVLGLPCVCSPRAAFAGAIGHGVDGFLAEEAADWADALTALLKDTGLRARTGEAALVTALARYAPEAIAGNQLAAIVRRFAEPRTDRLRVMVVNVHYAPQSFGGATIVAEEVARRLDARADMDVVVVTSTWAGSDLPYTVSRYEVEGVPVLAVRLATPVPAPLDYANGRMEDVFHDLLEAVKPDVVHFHAVQGLSASTMEACLKAGVPYVSTLHDSWWICERQFMVRPEGRYCFQETIDWTVCATCVGDLGASMRRAARLRPLLDGASLLLTPSEFHRQLHLANGVAAERIAVNRNGVARPARPRPPRGKGTPMRFGFVGGVGPIKGLDLIRRVFEAAASPDWELVLVDNTTNLGFSSVNADDWRVRGEVTVIPAYTQATMEDFFGRIDVLLFPSQWKESFGLTVREALVRDIWVVVTDAGGAAEDVVPGENGTIIPLGDDVGPLAAEVERLLVNPSVLDGYRNPYKDRIATYEEQAEELARFLRSAIARPVDSEAT